MDANTTTQAEKGKFIHLRVDGAKFNLSFFLWSDESNIKTEEIAPWVRRALNTTQMDGDITILLAPTIHEQTVKRAATSIKVTEIRGADIDILSSLKKLRKEKHNIKHYGEYNIVIVGRTSDLEKVIEYCNAIYTYEPLNTAIVHKDRPKGIESFNLYHDGRAEAHEYQCYRRVFERKLSVQSLLSVATCSWYTVPNTTTTCVAINIGSYNVAIGESHAAPSSQYSKELGIKYAKENAINEAREHLGAMFAFNEHLGIEPRPALSRYALWDMADFTEALIKYA